LHHPEGAHDFAPFQRGFGAWPSGHTALLFAGRAGMIMSAATEGDADLVPLLRGLRWHALSYGDGLAFPGNQLLRLSMDLASGTAGVLMAIGAALHDRPVCLPLFAGTHGGSPTDLDAVRHSSTDLISGRR